MPPHLKEKFAPAAEDRACATDHACAFKLRSRCSKLVENGWITFRTTLW